MEHENVPNLFGVCRPEGRGLGRSSFQLKLCPHLALCNIPVNIKI